MSGRAPNGKPLPDGALAHPASALSIYCAGLSDSTINGLCGAMAGMASGIVTCPLDVIKTRLQAQGSFRRLMRPDAPTGAIYNGLIGTAKTIWVQDGVKGMYRGLGPMLLGYLPTWAVYMSVYDSSRQYYYTHVGTANLAENGSQNTNRYRKQMACTGLRLRDGWSMLKPCHQPHMGYQNSFTLPQNNDHHGNIAVQSMQRARCTVLKASESFILA